MDLPVEAMERILPDCHKVWEDRAIQYMIKGLKHIGVRLSEKDFRRRIKEAEATRDAMEKISEMVRTPGLSNECFIQNVVLISSEWRRKMRISENAALEKSAEKDPTELRPDWDDQRESGLLTE